MCTAATYRTRDFYFGRTLDYECSYGEEIAILPRRFPLNFRQMGTNSNHYAMIGVAHVEEGVPLYYDAINEKGLGMAGLNFVGNAVYRETVSGRDNLAQFEFIPWILSQCASVEEARAKLQRVNITNTPFSNRLPLAELHWIIADKNGAVTVESVKDGVFVYDNPAGVLTNNPPFPEQLFALNNYMDLSNKDPENRFCRSLPLHCYSRGMGALGLPGDLSSQSRFIRAAFVRANACSGDSEMESVNQFFHILGAVEQQKGCCDIGNGVYEYTIYTSCGNASKGIYYYTSYLNPRFTAVSMYHENLDGMEMVRYPMLQEQEIIWQN